MARFESEWRGSAQGPADGMCVLITIIFSNSGIIRYIDNLLNVQEYHNTFFLYQTLL